MHMTNNHTIWIREQDGRSAKQSKLYPYNTFRKKERQGDLTKIIKPEDMS